MKAFFLDVPLPPTICFGRLIFKHTGDLNFKVIGVRSPESHRTINEVTTPFGKSLQINLEVQLEAPDCEEPDQELVKNPASLEQSDAKIEPAPDHPPRRRRKRDAEISIIDITQPTYDTKRLVGRWRDEAWFAHQP
jgi:hypothetical protein